ncbi:APC family permease [Specibacter cremeus]|uniref:APC family permease n=1 Tax=Specibacter cremeus TaxID=1629051 RepID=UPI001F0C52F9|nr:APC family permease [Specibacter cremeus]
MICYLFLGIYLQQYAPDVPVAVWIVGAVVLVTALNVLGIKMVAKMNLIMVGVQIVFVAVFILASVRTMSGQAVPSLTAPFFSPDMPVAGVLAGSALLCLSFLGFDAVSTLAEETDNPRVRIPRAIILCTLIGGGLYIMISYTAQMVFPGYTFNNVDAATIEVMTHAGGNWLAVFFTAAYCAGLFACAIASQASVSRILYAMGRDAALPKRVFGKMNARFSTPVNATLISGAFGLTALFVDGTTAAAVISFGALTAFTFVNLSVIKHYVIDKGLRRPRDIVRFAVLPGCGVALTLWLWSNLNGLTFTVGFIWVGLGLVWLLSLTRMFRRRLPEITFNEDLEPDGQQEATVPVA